MTAVEPAPDRAVYVIYRCHEFLACNALQVRLWPPSSQLAGGTIEVRIENDNAVVDGVEGCRNCSMCA